MNTFFYIAASVTILTAAMAVSRRNAIHALLYLILLMLSLSVAFYLLQAPFIAVLEVIIYAGAIIVLFIFVTMMLNVWLEEKMETRWMQPKM